MEFIKHSLLASGLQLSLCPHTYMTMSFMPSNNYINKALCKDIIR